MIYWGNKRIYVWGYEYLGDKQTLYKKDLSSSTTEVFFVADGWFMEAKMSPNRKYVHGIINRRDSEGDSKLLILNADGKILFEDNNNARRAEWTNDGDKLVFITGEKVEAIRGYRNTRIWMYDVKDSRFDEIQLRAADLHHAGFDDCFYFHGKTQDGKVGVFKFDPGSKELTQTLYKDSYLSSSGKYYYTDVKEGAEGFYQLVYDTEVNVIVDTLCNLDSGHRVKRIEWLPGDLLLVEGVIWKNWHSFVYDIQNQNVLTQIEGTLIALHPYGASTLAIFKGETIEFDSLGNMYQSPYRWE